jgi:hypothetical protein
MVVESVPTKPMPVADSGGRDVSDEEECSVELHLRAHIESGDLVEKENSLPWLRWSRSEVHRPRWKWSFVCVSGLY